MIISFQYKQFSPKSMNYFHHTVPAAMAAAFEKSKGEALMERMMRALEAAEAEGGDIRGSQSAAMVVYGSEDKPHWENRICDLRVDEHKNPIKELRRLVAMRLADLHGDKGEKYAAAGAQAADLKKAQLVFAEARKMSPDASEMTFWQALVLADNHGLIEEARALLGPLIKKEAAWEELLRRLVAMGPGLLDHPEVVEKLMDKEKDKVVSKSSTKDA